MTPVFEVRVQRIYSLLRQHPEGRTTGEIAKYVGMARNSVSNYMTTLTERYPLAEELLPNGRKSETNYFLVDWRSL